MSSPRICQVAIFRWRLQLTSGKALARLTSEKETPSRRLGDPAGVSSGSVGSCREGVLEHPGGSEQVSGGGFVGFVAEDSRSSLLY